MKHLLSTLLIGTALTVSSSAMARVAPETVAPLASSAMPEGNTPAQIAGYAKPEGHTQPQIAAYPEPEGHTQPQIALN